MKQAPAIVPATVRCTNSGKQSPQVWCNPDDLMRMQHQSRNNGSEQGRSDRRADDPGRACTCRADMGPHYRNRSLAIVEPCSTGSPAQGIASKWCPVLLEGGTWHDCLDHRGSRSSPNNFMVRKNHGHQGSSHLDHGGNRRPDPCDHGRVVGRGDCQVIWEVSQEDPGTVSHVRV